MDRSAFRYQPFYCEENAWWLIRAAALSGRPRWAVFLSNSARAFAMGAQKAAPPNQAVVWDYHCVILADGPSGPEVWDLDHRGAFPTALSAWLGSSFPPGVTPPRCRAVPSDEHFALFASDRRHMRTEDGFRAPPPPWPCIVSPGGAVHTLDAFLEMSGPGPGSLLEAVDLEALCGR